MGDHRRGVQDRAPAVRIVVVDDHPTFTDLVRLALGNEPDLDCVGTAHDPAQARVQVAEHHPDILLMDVELGQVDGLDLAAELLGLSPAMRLVVLTGHGGGRVLRRAAAQGACALLLKDGSLDDLLSGLRNARAGEMFVHPRLLRDLVVAPVRQGYAAALLPQLTPREALVLDRLVEGRQVSGIAHDLGISVNTCRGYVKTLLAKLGAHSQLEAVAIAGKMGLRDAPKPR